jgi:PilZ domain
VLSLKRRSGRASAGLSNLPIRRSEVRCADTRNQDRHHLRGTRFLVTHRDREREVDVVNLSGGGAMIACRFVPNLCERIDLHLGEGGTIECLVRWVKRGRIGLEFAHETQLHCSDDEQAALLRQVVNCAFPTESFEGHAAAEQRSDQRASTRHPLIWSGKLLHGPTTWAVRLRNVSTTGALLESEKSLREGAEVVLDLGQAGSVNATVSWAVGDHLGLRFDEPFDMSRLSKSQPRVAPPTWLRPSHFENDAAAESPWDDAWNRMSVDELRAELEGYLKR